MLTRRFFIIFILLFMSLTNSAYGIKPNRSLAVTELDILSRFELESVLDALIATHQSQEQQTARTLWLQWLGQNGECDELNGFPLTCRFDEIDFDQTPFTVDHSTFSYSATGLFNRFDLASSNGLDCGEYRLIFNRGHTDFMQEKTLIFEARLANPEPEKGLLGCAPVAKFWQALSAMDSNDERASALHQFYFAGLPGFLPVIHYENFARGDNSGQVRTNSFMDNAQWSMREFALQSSCAPICTLEFSQTETTDNPAVSLVSDTSDGAFQDWFIDYLGEPNSGLLADSIGAITFPVPTAFNAAESILPESRAFPLFIDNISDNASAAFRARIQEKLDDLDIDLTAKQVLNRANSATCNGCHRTATPAFSAANTDMGFATAFPSVSRFRHVHLNAIEAGPDGERYTMSLALKNEFLPFREQKFKDYLALLSPLSASFVILSAWDDGYCANVTIENTGNETVTWAVEIALNDASLESAWSSEITPTDKGFLAKGYAWNAEVIAGGTQTLGYCASIQGANWQPAIVATDTL